MRLDGAAWRRQGEDMARPKSEGETREEMLFIRVNRTEQNAVLGAVPINQSVSSWARQIIMQHINGTASAGTAIIERVEQAQE